MFGGRSAPHVRARDERRARADLLQHFAQLRARAAVEPTRGLVREQHERLEREAARYEHTPLLAARELQKRPLGQVRDRELPHDLQRLGALRGSRAPPRDVRSIDAGQHDVERREIPVPTRVTILQLVADEHDSLPRLHSVALLTVAEVVDAHAAVGRRPKRSRNEIEKAGFAAAVCADDAPMLAPRKLPIDRVQHRCSCESDVDAGEADERRCSSSIKHSALGRSRVYLKDRACRFRRRLLFMSL